jgi:hypothetical protein
VIFVSNISIFETISSHFFFSSHRSISRPMSLDISEGAWESDCNSFNEDNNLGLAERRHAFLWPDGLHNMAQQHTQWRDTWELSEVEPWSGSWASATNMSHSRIRSRARKKLKNKNTHESTSILGSQLNRKNTTTLHYASLLLLVIKKVSGFVTCHGYSST